MRADLMLSPAEQAVEQKLLRYYAAGDPAAAFVAQLRQQLNAQAAAAPAPRAGMPRLWARWLTAPRGTRWAAAAAALLLVAALVIGAVGPQRVWAGMQRLLGYVPGVGLVQNTASLRVLAEPVTVTRQGITLTVQQATADAQRTILVWEVAGLSVKAANSQGEGGGGGPIGLRLANGQTLALLNGQGQGWGTGQRERNVFPPLPTTATTVTLVLARLPGYPPHAGPEDWELPLRFVPAPAGMVMLPVLEVTPVFPAAPGPAETRATPPGNEAAGADAPHGIQVQLEQAIELPDGYQLQGSLRVPASVHAYLAEPELAHVLQDADGRPIPAAPVEPDVLAAAAADAAFHWAVRTNTKDAPGPWRLSIPAIVLHVATEAPFAIDLGPDPQLGQAWTLDQPLTAVDQPMRITAARLWADSAGRIWLNLDFAGGPDLLAVHFARTDRAGRTTTYSDGLVAPGRLNAGLVFAQKPGGLLRLQVTAINVRVAGPWQMTWQPPAATTRPQAALTPAAAPCLTADAWAQLIRQPLAPAAPLPMAARLPGRLLFQEYSGGGSMPLIYLANTDGTQRREIAHGAWSALSPDGSTVIFAPAEGDGLRVADVRTGRITPLPGTAPGDYHPVWSPDGEWIAFTHGLSGLYVVRPDGSGLRQVSASELIQPVGWFPAGRQLLATVPGPDGEEVLTIQVATGAAEKSFAFDSPRGGFAALAPDGRRFAFSAPVFGEPAHGVSLANLDGTGLRLLATFGAESGRPTAWSPDGAWLAVTVGGATPLLIRPDTCEVMRLPLGQGEVTSWVLAQP